jgi:hypothetical protein
MNTKTKLNMDLVSKKEIKTITSMAEEMAKAIATIDQIHSEFRELTGFAETDVCVFSTDINLSSDKKELAESLIEHCVDARSNWIEY